MSAPAPDEAAVLALDIGGTTIKAALVGIDGTTLARDVRPTEHGDAALRALVESATILTVRAAEQHRVIVGAGVVSPGMVDEATGTVRYASNLGWHNAPVGAVLARATGAAPVAVGHDARSAGVAEGIFGAARGCPDYVHVSIGTGIAAAIVVQGRALGGTHGGAGEMGHTPVHPDGEACVCGQRGCLEVYASGAGLARRFRARTGRDADAAALATLMAHDADARAVWDDGVHALALALATSTLLLDPGLIVIGGGLALAGDRLLAPLRSRLQAQLHWRDAPPVVATTLGARAALAGAALLAMQAAGLSDEVRAWPAGPGVHPGRLAAAGATDA